MGGGCKIIVTSFKYREHRMGAVQSRDLKNWEDISDQVYFPEGARHWVKIFFRKFIITII